MKQRTMTELNYTRIHKIAVARSLSGRSIYNFFDLACQVHESSAAVAVPKLRRPRVSRLPPIDTTNCILIGVGL